MQAELAEVELIDAVAAFEHDPYGYVLFAYPWGEGELAQHTGPDEWQKETLCSVRDNILTLDQALQIAACSGHGVGKSALVAWIIDWAMTTKVDTQGVVTANTENQLRTKTWKEMAKWHRLSICGHWFKLEGTSLHSIDPDHEKTWRIDIIPWSVHKTEAFAGLHNEGNRIIIIFDEASAIHDDIWEVTEGALTDENTEIIWCVFGNGTRNTGRFRECFRKFRHRWTTWQVDSRNARVTNKKQIENLIEDHGVDSDIVKVRVRRMFPSISSKLFISVEDADAGRGKHLRKEQYEWAPKIIAVEPSWEGDDEFVIGMRQGLYFQILSTFQKNDNDVHCANLIAEFEDRHQADAVFIDGGYGTGIVSVGRTLKRDWQIVWFGGASADAGCLNKRSEMWNLMKKWLKEGGAYPDDDLMYTDLIGPETVSRLDGKIQLEKKSHMKDRGIPSPNRADCLAITFAFPVSSKYTREHKPGQTNARREYNPMTTRLRDQRRTRSGVAA